MRNLFLAAAAFAAFALPASAQTGSVSFSILNSSDATIDSILYGQSSSDEWSDNILDYQVEPGDTVEITIDDGLEDCMYDFYYIFDDGSDCVEVDCCHQSSAMMSRHSLRT